MSSSSARTENSKYRGVYFGCTLLCRDKRSRSKGDNKHTWHQSEVTAIDAGSMIQLHYSGSPLKYDRWMSLQSDWKDLAPPKFLTKKQIDNGNPLDNAQATIVYDYLLSGELTMMNSDLHDNEKPDIMTKQSSTSSITSDTPTGNFELFVGQKIEVMDYFQTKPNEGMKEKWRYAQVVDISSEFIRIHFSGWDPKWDEDISVLKIHKRIRERKRKVKRRDSASLGHPLTTCPHCGESLLTLPLEDSLETPVGSRRSSIAARTDSVPPEHSHDDALRARDVQREEPEPLPQLLESLSVDDRIQIALKVADRRLSSIQCTRSLMGVSTRTDARDRQALAGPLLRVTSRRASHPPPEHSRVTYDMYK